MRDLLLLGFAFNRQIQLQPVLGGWRGGGAGTVVLALLGGMQGKQVPGAPLTHTNRQDLPDQSRSGVEDDFPHYSPVLGMSR